jgi:hypothetical protein
VDVRLFLPIADIASDRPFAVAEKGFNATELVLRQCALRIHGSESGQTQYMHFLLEQGNRLDAEFVVWFFCMDYDDFWSRVKATDIGELFMIWDHWLSLPRG